MPAVIMTTPTTTEKTPTTPRMGATETSGILKNHWVTRTLNGSSQRGRWLKHGGREQRGKEK